MTKSDSITQSPSLLWRLIVRAIWSGVWSVVLIGFAWSIGAVRFLTYLPEWIAVAIAVVYGCMGLALLWRANPKRRWLRYAGVAWLVVYSLSLLQQPSNDREWAIDHSRLSTIDIVDDEVTIHDLRMFRYETETDFKSTDWRDVRFRLSDVTSVWFGVQRFTSLEGIAHTFLCFQIRDAEPEYICVSVEIRRETDEGFSPVRGMYRQFELIYVISDEPDEVVMRTVHRPDDRVYLFPVNANAKLAQMLFVDIAQRVNGLAQHPEFYNSFTSNCTNNIAAHTRELDPDVSLLDWRIVIPGYSDRFAWSKGLVGESGESFTSVRDRYRIDEIARKFGDRDGFSEAIRPEK